MKKILRCFFVTIIFTMIFAMGTAVLGVSHSHSTYWETYSAATCTSSGKEYQFCTKSTCTYYKPQNVRYKGAGSKYTPLDSEVISKLDHDWSNTWSSDESSHWHKCSICGAVNTDSKTGHTWSTTYLTNSTQHWKTCTACGREGSKIDHDFEYISSGDIRGSHRCKTCYETGVHTLDANHECTNSVCNFNANSSSSDKVTSFHYFPSGVETKCSLCGEYLRINACTADGLPKVTQYTTVDNPHDMAEQSFGKLDVTFNYIPYLDENMALPSISVKYQKYIHVNVQTQMKAIEANVPGIATSSAEMKDTLSEYLATEPLEGWKYTTQGYVRITAMYAQVEGYSPDGDADISLFHNGGVGIGNISKQISNLGMAYEDPVPSTDSMDMTAQVVKYTVKDFSAMKGHYCIQELKIGNYRKYLGNENRLFVNGPHVAEDPVQIKAYFITQYRDLNGREITGAPRDKTQSKVVYYNGTTTTQSFSSTANHTPLDNNGWRYCGYKLYKGIYGASGVGVNSSSLTRKDTASTKLEFGIGKQVATVVFYYEPIKITIEQWNETTNSKIPTNKNETILMPDYIMNGQKCWDGDIKTHNCNTRGCSGKNSHTIESLNKFYWPGYILQNYQLFTEVNGASRTKVSENTASTSLGTGGISNINLSDVQVSVPIDVAVGGGNVGYRKDKVIRYNYKSVNYQIAHYDTSNNTLLKDITNTRNLSYAANLSGHSIVAPSLITTGQNQMFMGGSLTSYDVSQYVLKRINILVGGENKLTLTKDNVPSGIYPSFEEYYMVYGASYPALTNISEDTVANFYYQKAAKVHVYHQDESGNTLLPTECVIIPDGQTSTTVNPATKDELPGYTNQGSKKTENQATLDPAGSVTVTRALTDFTPQTVIFVYKKDNESTENLEKTVKLRSNSRTDGNIADTTNEEYIVDGDNGAIPTSEDMYANVFAESFKLTKTVKLKTQTEKVKLKLLKQYYKTNNYDSETITNINNITDSVYAYTSGSYVTISALPFDTYTAEDAELRIISKALVRNSTIYDLLTKAKGLLEIKASYADEPYMEYEKGGTLVLNDLAVTNTSGKEVSSYISSTKKAVAPGFYNVTRGSDGYLTATLVLDGIDYEKNVSMSNLEKEYKANDNKLLVEKVKRTASAKMDTLKVHYFEHVENGGKVEKVYNVLSGSLLSIDRVRTLAELEAAGIVNLYTTAPLVDEDVLYRRDNVRVLETIANGTYNTTADIYYRLKQKIENGVCVAANGDEQMLETLTGNDVKVHTPVVNNMTISDKTDCTTNNQLVNQVNNELVLGRTFEITIPHNYQHITVKGYGNKEYNYGGLIAEDTDTDMEMTAFAKEKQIKFEFDTLYKKDGAWVYLRANEWNALEVSLEKYTFMVAPWAEEVWNNRTTSFSTRVIAENVQNTDYSKANQDTANKDKINYIATKTLTVKIVGELYDLKVSATNDPAWARFKDGTALDVSKLPLGQASQNNSTAYKSAIKLGYKTYFDIKTNGYLGDTTHSIEIAPAYYHISSDGKTVEKVDLYYDSTTKMYNKMSDAPINFAFAINNQYVKTYNNLTTELANAVKQVADKILLTTSYNYIKEESIGNSSKMTLTLAQRLPYANAMDTIKGKVGEGNVGNTPADAIYGVGHWYGMLRLPSTTKMVLSGTTNVGVSTKFITDGYIAVTFEKIVSKTQSDTEYLSYDLPQGNTRWALEGSTATITLPNGVSVTNDVLQKAIVLYEANARANSDKEVSGTH